MTNRPIPPSVCPPKLPASRPRSRCLWLGLSLSLAVVLLACGGDEQSANRPPTLVPVPDATLDLGQTLELDLDTTDPDGDQVALTLHSAPVAATLDGVALRWTPGADDVGVHSFIVAATDNGAPALTVYVAFAVTVLDPAAPGVNHPPLLVPPADVHMDVGSSLSLTLSASDPDGDGITLAVELGPSGATLAGDTFAWSPQPADVGAHGVVLSATDDGVPPLTSLVAFAITVHDPVAERANHAPMIDPVGVQHLAVGETLAVTVTATDPDGDSLTWSALGLPQGALFDVGTAELTWTPAAGDAGAHYAVLRVTDDGNPPLSATVAIRIEVFLPGAGNLAPVFFGVAAPGFTDACQPFSASFEALDPDGDPLTYASPNLPDGATLTPGGSTVVLDWTPDSSQGGTHTVALYAIDDGEPTMSTAIIYTIEVVAPPPLGIDPIGPALVPGGDALVVPVTVATHNCYGLEVVGLPTGALWDAGLNQITWGTAVEDFGLYEVTFTLRDLSVPGIEVSETAEITVSFLDPFAAFTLYNTHEVIFPGYGGPVDYVVASDAEAADGLALHSSSAEATDVHGWAFLSFTRSALPISRIDYSFDARDVVVGPACGSGAQLELLDFDVTDPTVTWPDWSTLPTPVAVAAVVDGSTYTTVADSALLTAPVTEVTVALHHSDSSNICTVDAYWDLLELIPY